MLTLLFALYNSLIAFGFCSPIVSLFHCLGQLIAARIFRLHVKEIAFGFGPIILMWGKFSIRVVPFWFWIRWDSQKLRTEFNTRPLAKNYVKIMWPNPQKTASFDELCFVKKNCVLLSGYLANLILYFLIIWWISFNDLYFDAGMFFQSLIHKAFYGLWFLVRSELVVAKIDGINPLYSTLMLNCFFMLINFLPLKFLDGQELWITFLEKITKKSINGVVNAILHILGKFWLTWLLCSFLISWQA